MGIMHRRYCGGWRVGVGGTMGHYLQAERHLPNVEHIQVLQDVQSVLHLCTPQCLFPCQTLQRERVGRYHTAPQFLLPLLPRSCCPCPSALLLDPSGCCGKLSLPTTVPGSWWEPGMGGKQSKVRVSGVPTGEASCRGGSGHRVSSLALVAAVLPAVEEKGPFI